MESDAPVTTETEVQLSEQVSKKVAPAEVAESNGTNGEVVAEKPAEVENGDKSSEQGTQTNFVDRKSNFAPF